MGVLCCHFRPKMFSPGDHVRYHSRTLGAHVLAGGVTPVDHESTQLSRLEAVAVESPKSPKSPDVTPMSPQPQTPAQPTQPTMAANVPRKRSLQSTLDAFLKPNPVVTDDGSDAIVQLTGSPTQRKRPRSPPVAEDAVFVSAVFSLLASMEGTTVCLEIPLQSPPPPGDRHLVTVSPPTRETVARYPGTLQGGRGVQIWMHCCTCMPFCPLVYPFRFQYKRAGDRIWARFGTRIWDMVWDVIGASVKKGSV